jgi:excisionase family DNA binding protein
MGDIGTEYLSPQDVAKIFACRTETVRRLIREGKIPFKRIGGITSRDGTRRVGGLIRVPVEWVTETTKVPE